MGHTLEIMAKYQTFSAIPVQDAGDDRNQCCLTAAGRANEHQQFSRTHLQIYATQGSDPGTPAPIRFGYTPAKHRNVIRI
ncbi:hypothetical protein BROSI_A1247 [Candidatus Brocadia sinica JPN1]|uniref:Uncharacterized protein n=1 Tax=Candidatus Brocadia sinica JPN1 TaxID=1197129 RepID=A0ABQ0JVT7_9BACT|nr:hypothetical protein BROSI_A1247 [Candidatus Brocadia sinica JPN1]GIK13737.1 MAG: hypothetical protein BroJett002_24440 [Candidatus Brocadia sinica]GJQ16490.1 MAG: hypothetical protein HBSIN01_04490 [Candidatus Brocadia sinica]